MQQGSEEINAAAATGAVARPVVPSLDIAVPMRVRVVGTSGVQEGLLESDGRTMVLRDLRAPSDEGHGPVTYLSAGWADMHCHVYAGVGTTGVAADRVGLAHGVHLLVDAGSAGAYTVDGFRDYVITPSPIPVLAWLNVSGVGLATVREFSRRDWLDVRAGIDAFDRHGDVLVGVKVRSCSAIVESLGLEPLEAALELAEAVEKPVMVHVGEAPPSIDDILARLRPGDVVTHCFHGKPGRPWDTDGRPVAALASALERGVLLDVGHGAASFAPDVAARAIAHQMYPHTISTDIHARNIHGPVYSLAHVMGRMVDAGMPIGRAVGAVTTAPRAVIGLAPPVAFTEGPVANATVFTVTSGTHVPDGRTRITVDAVIRDHAVAPGHAWAPSHAS